MDKIYGKKPVLEILKSVKTVNKVYLLKGTERGGCREIAGLARKKNIPVQLIEKNAFDRMFSEKNHQGAALELASADYVDLEEILDSIENKENRLLLVLAGIEDPHNLGAILRTAEAAGVDGVIIPKRRAVPLTEGVARASAGAIGHIPVARVGNIKQTVDMLKENGYWSVVAIPEGESIYSQKLKGAIVLIIGSEEKGPGRLIEECSDYKVSLPMYGKINSLNASVATGIVLYELIRQREAE